MARPGRASRAQRFWFFAAALALLLVWLAWTFGVLLLKFSIYHSLVWSLRIAAFAFIVDSVLGLSARSTSEAGAGTLPPVAMWIPLAQGSIRVAAILAIAILLAEVWLVDELELVARQAWEPVRSSLITAALTLIAGYFAWRYLNQWTEGRLRAAVPRMGDAEEGDEARVASRLTTVLPVLRILLGITIVVMATLVALSQLGVNIGPLLAGAGVVGLAISFGSQALVRDIVSGIFFMADDAFRVGEYIDTGKLKGTVEKMSLRSVRLRHQNGQIHTIPFGQLTSISNFSRDWQTVKFNLRLARDSDIEKVRKAVKQLGQQMMQEPELGKELLQPLKLQGVAEIADNALVVRLKFTARPLKPSWVQREALKRIYKVFGDKGIEFASNAITVQSAGPVSAEAAGAGAAGGLPRAA
jgi:small-conductance mechanosensitive channel